MAFALFDTVRLVDVIARRRVMVDENGAGDEPQLGDTGTVVEIAGDGVYVVECGDERGETRWVGEFLEDELELAD